MKYEMDWDRTMERFGYDENLYIECLGMLLEDPNPSLLHTAISSGDLSAAFNAAHTLKGVAANMGLTPLLAAVSAIVEPLRHAEPIDYTPLLATLDRELSRVRLFHTSLTSR